MQVCPKLGRLFVFSNKINLGAASRFEYGAGNFIRNQPEVEVEEQIVTEVDTVKHFDVNLCDNLPIFWIFTTSTSISVCFPINAVCEPRVSTLVDVDAAPRFGHTCI